MVDTTVATVAMARARISALRSGLDIPFGPCSMHRPMAPPRSMQHAQRTTGQRPTEGREAYHQLKHESRESQEEEHPMGSVKACI